MGSSSVTFTVDTSVEETTLDGTKAIGEIPAGAILGLTENVGIGTAINFVLLAVVIGFGLFGYSSIKNRGIPKP